MKCGSGYLLAINKKLSQRFVTLGLKNTHFTRLHKVIQAVCAQKLGMKFRNY